MSSAILGFAKQSCKLGFFVHQKNIYLLLNTNLFKPQSLSSMDAKLLHTTGPNYDLKEFFDEEKNWGEDSVKVGRSWKKDELRVKSNSDLHKLWYVLLKERNMLMTMEHECSEEFEAFPNPERLDKVKESMHNLEEVVIERNRAYHELETGESGMRPAKEVINQLGLPFFHRMTEHMVPKFVNKKWRENHTFKDIYEQTKVFHAQLGEKREDIAKRNLKGQKAHVLGLMRRFPNLDLEAVKEKFPEVDVDRLKDTDAARGHWLP